MGLKKQKELPNGVTLDYWAIKQIDFFDMQAKTCRIHIFGWVGKTKKDNGAGYINEATQSFDVTPEEFDQYFSEKEMKKANKSLISNAYKLLDAKAKGGKKEVEFFVDSVEDETPP